METNVMVAYLCLQIYFRSDHHSKTQAQSTDGVQIEMDILPAGCYE